MGKKVKKEEVVENKVLKVICNQRKPDKKEKPFLCGRMWDHGPKIGQICDHRTGSQCGMNDHRLFHHHGTLEKRAIRKEKRRQKGAKKNSGKSITSLITFTSGMTQKEQRQQENQPQKQWELEDYTSDDDLDDPITQDLIKGHESTIQKYEESHKPFFGSLMVACKTKKPNQGLMKIFQRKSKLATPNFKMHIYAGTSESYGPCNYFAHPQTHGSSRFTEICLKRGYVCYTLNLTFYGGTTAENRDAAYLWQHYYKTIGQMLRLAPPNPSGKIEFEILNDGLRRKAGFKGVIPIPLFKKTIRIARQRRPLLPMMDDLLPIGPHEDWERYDFTTEA